MKEYKKNAYAEAIDSLQRLTGKGLCVTALNDLMLKVNADNIFSIFIKENGRMVSDFCFYFKGIEDVPSKFWTPLFTHYEENIAIDPFRKTKWEASLYLTGDYEHDAPYLSIISHLDCAAHSIVNQLKRSLGIFDRNKKLTVQDKKNK